MSYADILLQRRQDVEGAFRKRYNPAEDVLASLSDIDKQMQDASALKEKQRLESERFNLEKTKTEAEVQRANAEANKIREDQLALARERDARAAAEREAARRKAQEDALQVGAKDIYGRLLSKGQTMKNIIETSQAEERRNASEARRKDYAQKMADAMAAGNSAEVARLKGLINEEVKSSLAEGKPTAGGYTEADIQEMADAHGVLYGTMLTELQRIDAENEASRANLGLTGQKSLTEQARQKELLAAAAKYNRQAQPKPVSPEDTEKKAYEAEMRKIKLEQERLKKEKIENQIGAQSGFKLTPGQLERTQNARVTAVNARSGINDLRALVNKYPQIEDYTGPFDNLVSWAESKFGAQSKEVAEVRSAFGQVFQSYKLAQTGKAASDKEMSKLSDLMPSMTDSLPAILGKIDAYDGLIAGQIENWDLVLNARDIRAADKTPGVVPMPTQYSNEDKQKAASLGITLEQ
jgi:hypothetical protein